MARLLGVGGAHVVRHISLDGSFRAGEIHAGSVHERVEGTAYHALSLAAGLGVEAALLSLRGGDSAGAMVAEAIADAGIEDLSVTFLTRASPGRTLIADEQPDFVGGLVDDALYRRRFASQVMRRAFREELARADALIVDETVGEAALGRIVTGATCPVHGVVGTVDGFGAFTTQAAALASLTIPIATTSNPAETAAKLVGAGVRSAVLVGSASLFAYDEGGRYEMAVDSATGRLQAHLAGLAGVMIACRFERQGLAQALRAGVAAALLMQKAAPVDPTRLAELVAELPEPQVIGVR